GFAKQLSVQAGPQGEMNPAISEGLAEFIRGDCNGGKSRGRLGLVKPETFRQFGGDEVSQRDVVDDHQQLDVVAGGVGTGSHRYVVRYDGGFGFHVDAELLAGYADVVAGPQEVVGAALVDERVVPETVRHLGAPGFAHQLDMVHIG